MTGAAVDIKPITKAKPSNVDLAAGINQVHACFEEHKRSTSLQLAHVKTQVDKAARDAREATLDTKAIKIAMGLVGDKKPVAGLSSNWVSFRRTVFATTTSLTAAVVVYKVFVIAWPSLRVLWDSVKTAAAHGMLP